MSMKKQPKQARSQDTVDVLLEGTARILRREGRKGLTTNRVAKVAGVSVGSLYQYFPNKESLVDALRERYGAKFQERTSHEFETLVQLPLREAMREFVRFGIDIHREDLKLHNELSSEMSGTEHQRVVERVRAGLEAHRDEIRRPDLELATYLAVEVIGSLLHRTALHAPERLDDPLFFEEVCDLIERYILK